MIRAWILWTRRRNEDNLNPLRVFFESFHRRINFSYRKVLHEENNTPALVAALFRVDIIFFFRLLDSRLLEVGDKTNVSVPIWLWRENSTRCGGWFTSADAAGWEDEPVHEDAFAVIVRIVGQQSMPLVFLLATAFTVATICMSFSATQQKLLTLEL